MAKTFQEKAWLGKFGKEYTDRNMMSPDGLDQLYINNYGVSRTKLNKEFLTDLNVSKVLEVGCNVGNQLLVLKKMGYPDLWGIEPQGYAIKILRKRTDDINVVKGSAFNIPFKDNYFDMVSTSCVLIHISPKNVERVLHEIHRCTNMYILGFEYYVPTGYQMVNYRGHDNLLWKTDFSRLFLDRFSDLQLVRKRILKYRDNDNLDIMYLLKKSGPSDGE